MTVDLSILQNCWFNSSSTGKLDQVGLSAGFLGNAASIRNGNSSVSSGTNLRTRPFSLMDPDIPQLAEGFGDHQRRSSRENPFAKVQLRHTVTNDRSAPVVR
ncbi:brain-specific angiogenesis inhibitor 1-associated protein 2-like [Rhincodon typus]|uniref:brain-specific angiogenesis inhibitor 1-associated protein 2-like n=1 Tax=Rhincodon typus TaxID=259920 RepID=UPI0020307F6C|nr:brain-specific angiogenesis inhibitor 1-associated protein 2-like [Rhincodon typus]